MVVVGKSNRETGVTARRGSGGGYHEIVRGGKRTRSSVLAAGINGAKRRVAALHPVNAPGSCSRGSAVHGIELLCSAQAHRGRTRRHCQSSWRGWRAGSSSSAGNECQSKKAGNSGSQHIFHLFNPVVT